MKYILCDEIDEMDELELSDEIEDADDGFV